jgi:hypothetical protein
LKIIFFDAYRVKFHNIALAEPVFRDADIVSVDLNSVKSSDSGTLRLLSNGFNGKKFVPYHVMLELSGCLLWNI